jgi:hypothetical protein
MGKPFAAEEKDDVPQTYGGASLFPLIQEASFISYVYPM